MDAIYLIHRHRKTVRKKNFLAISTVEPIGMYFWSSWVTSIFEPRLADALYLLTISVNKEGWAFVIVDKVSNEMISETFASDCLSCIEYVASQ